MELLQRRLAELGKPTAPTAGLHEEKVKPSVNCEETLPPETVGDGSEPHQEGKTGHIGAQCLAADGEECSGLPGRKLTLLSLLKFSGNRSDVDAFDRWVRKLSRHAELGRWTDREKLLQMELHLSGCAEQMYEILPEESKATFAEAVKSLKHRLRHARNVALMSAQVMKRRQRYTELADEYAQGFEGLFERSSENVPEWTNPPRKC